MNPEQIENLFKENGPLRNSVTQIGLLDKLDNGTITSKQIKKLMTTAVTQVNLLEDKEGNNSEFDPENLETANVFEDDEIAIDDFETAGNGEEIEINPQLVPNQVPGRMDNGNILGSNNPDSEEENDSEEEFPEVDEEPEEDPEEEPGE